MEKNDGKNMIDNEFRMKNYIIRKKFWKKRKSKCYA